MTTPLTSAQLANLQSILANTTLTTDQRTASYYQTLSSYGYAYGTLALGVVNNSTVSGQISNDFTAIFAAQQGATYNATVASDIRFQLAKDDLAARVAANGNDISYQTIQAYHQSAFGLASVPANAWSANLPLQILGTTAWNLIMNNNLASDTVLFKDMNLQITANFLSGSFSVADLIVLWCSDVVLATAEAAAQDAGTALQASVISELKSFIGNFQKVGYYVVQPSDTTSSIITALQNDGGLAASAVDSTTLMRINALFGSTTLTSGSLLRVPVGNPITPTTGTNQSLPTLPGGQTYIYDPASGKVYTVGASLDGHDSGALIVDAAVSGVYSSFAQGTYSGLTLLANGNVAVDVTNPNGTALGTETFNPSTDTVVATISNGVTTFNTMIGSGAVAEVQDNFSAHTASVIDQYTFAQPNGTLQIEKPLTFVGTINGFGLGDTIDLAGIGKATGATLGSGNVLTVSGGSSTVTLNLGSTPNFIADSFVTASDGNGGTNLTAVSLVGLNNNSAGLVNPESGAVTALTATSSSFGVLKLGAEAAENGYLYVSTGSNLLTVNLSTGQSTSVASTIGNFKADNLTGALVGVSGTNIVTVNPTTGATKTIATIAGLGSVSVTGEAALNGYFYVFNGTLLYSVNITTGQVTSAPSTVGLFVGDNLTGKLVGVSGSNVVTINPATGATTVVASLASAPAINTADIAAQNGVFDFDGSTSSGSGLFAVNITTGQVSISSSAVRNFVSDDSVTQTVAQFLADNAGVSAGVSGITIMDTAANIVASISQLNTAALSIGAINTLGQSPALSAAQVTQYGAITKMLSYGFTVTDTAANVVANIAALETAAVAGRLISVTLTDSTTPTLALTSAQDAADSAVLGKIVSAYNLTVSGVTAANAAAVAAQAHFASESVSDTAANFVSNIAALETLAKAGEITAIAFTDSTKPTITLTAAQQTADADALSKITSAYNLVITGATVTAAVAATATSAVAVSDTSANVLTYLSQLQTQAAAGRITSIAFTDSSTPTLPLTAAQYAADTTVLGKITSAYNLSISGVTAANAATVAGAAHVTSITVSDTSANVLTNIAALETLATGTKLASIALTDSATPTLALTAAQFTADSAALGKITSAYNLTVSGVTAANAATVAGAAHVTSIIVSDTSANIFTNIAALETLATGTVLSAITLTDSSTPTLSLTAAQYSTDTAALGKITSAYSLSISGVTAANASTVAGAAHVTSITVSDTGANVVTNIAALETLTTGTKLSSITLTDSTTPTLALNAAQYASDTAALAKIASAYNLSVSGVTAAGATATAGAAHVTSITVSDTSANVLTNIAALETLATGTKLASIALTDTTTPTLALTAAQFTADGAVLGKITSAYNLSIVQNGVTFVFAQNALASLAVTGTSATFTINSVAVGFVETISWTSGGKALLNLINASKQVFSSSLGVLTSGETVQVSNTAITVLSSAGQIVNTTQVNADGSQIDSSFDMVGAAWKDVIYSYNAAGVNTEIRYDNNNGTLVDDFYNGGGTLTGQTIFNGDGILHANNSNITNISTAGMTTLDVTASASLTAAQLAGFTSLTNGTGSADTLYATTSGSYSIATKTVTGNFNLSGANTTANVTLIGNNQAGQILTGGAGADTLTPGTGNDTLNGGTGYTVYSFGTVFGQDTINDAYAGNMVAKGEIDFAAGITDEKLWFVKSGNNLVIDLLGTKDQITVTNWFGSAGADVQTMNAGGLKLDTQVAQLVQAMATYASAHSSFNPVTATAMPTDTTLQHAITASWHA